MSRLMFVTVGTSLLYSASWDPARPGFPAGLPSYDRAVKESPFLNSPEERQRRRGPSDELKAQLSEENGEQWAAWLPDPLHGGRHDLGSANRYSAELSTMLRLVEDEARGHSARQHLQGYDRIFIVADPRFYDDEDRRRSYVAACHLLAYLQLLRGEAEGGVELLPIEGLASADPAELVGRERNMGLQLLGRTILERERELRATALDLVVTGGFKVYGYVLIRLLDAFGWATVRVIYGHERGDKLVKLNREAVEIGGHGLPMQVFREGLAPGS